MSNLAAPAYQKYKDRIEKNSSQASVVKANQIQALRTLRHAQEIDLEFPSPNNSTEVFHH